MNHLVIPADDGWYARLDDNSLETVIAWVIDADVIDLDENSDNQPSGLIIIDNQLQRPLPETLIGYFHPDNRRESLYSAH